MKIEFATTGLLGYVKRVRDPIMDDYGNEVQFFQMSPETLRARAHFLYETGHIEVLTHLFVI